tara:strand:- start:201 stop:353 length:153 start_codon:yes stop_codon:yes gene_type:complete
MQHGGAAIKDQSDQQVNPWAYRFWTVVRQIGSNGINALHFLNPENRERRS